MGNILKTSVILSAIVGFAAGILLLIPFLTPLIFFMLFIAIGAGIIIYLKKKDLVGFLTVQDGVFIGAVSGFISLVAASVVCLPVWFLIDLFFGKHPYKFDMIGSPMVASYNLIFILMMVFFVALLSAVFNAFSGMVAAYIYEKVEYRPFELPHFEIEQDE